MTRTRYRMQSTLTFLAKSLVAVNTEIGRLKEQQERKEPDAHRLRLLQAQRLALMEAIRQFDPELDPEAIASGLETRA